MPASTPIRTLFGKVALGLLALGCAVGLPAAASASPPSNPAPAASVTEASLTSAAPPPAPILADAASDAEADTSSASFGMRLLRKGGESCFFGAGTGAASILLSSLQMPTTGLATSGLFGLALGAASFGCAVGFMGATAASGFSYFWEQSVETTPRGTVAPQPGSAPAGTAP